jgi:hypothetical protein
MLTMVTKFSVSALGIDRVDRMEVLIDMDYHDKDGLPQGPWATKGETK